MAGHQITVGHVENGRAAHDAVRGSNAAESMHFKESKLRPKVSPTITLLHPFAAHGAPIDHDVHPQVDAVESHPELWWSKLRHVCQDAFSEFFGVFVLILFGNGSIAQVLLSEEQKGEYQSISWGEFHDPSTTLLLPFVDAAKPD